MLDLKIIINIFYNPTHILRRYIEQNQHLYIPVNGGSSLKNYDLWCNKYLFFDNVGLNNISNLNSKLNEMTSIYWFWKNYFPYHNNVEYVGFNHYRRLFDPQDFKDYHLYDCIVGKPIYFNVSLISQYGIAHHQIDINILYDMLKQDFNQDIVNYFMNLTELYAPCNMFIMKSIFFEEYCNFMFKYLLQLDKCIIVDNNDMYQHRALAFLSERLTSFWLFQKKGNLNIKEITIKFFERW